MQSYLKVKIEEGTSYNIKCPCMFCGIYLLDSEIEPLLDEGLKIKRHAVSLKLAIAGMEDYQYVLITCNSSYFFEKVIVLLQDALEEVLHHWICLG